MDGRNGRNTHMGSQHVGPSPMGGHGTQMGGPMEYGGPLQGGGFLVHPRGSGGLGGHANHNGNRDTRWVPSPGSYGSYGMTNVGDGMLGNLQGSMGGNGGGHPIHNWNSNGVGGPNNNIQHNPDTNGGRKHPTSNPDFVVVYTFLAGLFDPSRRDHKRTLKQMAPIDRETTLLLMRNLGANLMCQRMWEDQIQLIGAGYPTFVNASYDERGALSGAAGGHAVTNSAAVTRNDPSDGSDNDPSDEGQRGGTTANAAGEGDTRDAEGAVHRDLKGEPSGVVVDVNNQGVADGSYDEMHARGENDDGGSGEGPSVDAETNGTGGAGDDGGGDVAPIKQSDPRDNTPLSAWTDELVAPETTEGDTKIESAV